MTKNLMPMQTKDPTAHSGSRLLLDRGGENVAGGG